MNIYYYSLTCEIANDEGIINPDRGRQKHNCGGNWDHFKRTKNQNKRGASSTGKVGVKLLKSPTVGPTVYFLITAFRM